MYLTNMEIVKVIALVIYLYSFVIYSKQLFEDLRQDGPKILSEWLGFILVLVGAFTPILNTYVTIQIMKFKRKQ